MKAGFPLNNAAHHPYQVMRCYFAGVIDKLDYIKALGFTAIWITPIVQNASGLSQIPSKGN